MAAKRRTRTSTATRDSILRSFSGSVGLMKIFYGLLKVLRSVKSQQNISAVCVLASACSKIRTHALSLAPSFPRSLSCVRTQTHAQPETLPASELHIHYVHSARGLVGPHVDRSRLDVRSLLLARQPAPLPCIPPSSTLEQRNCWIHAVQGVIEITRRAHSRSDGVHSSLWSAQLAVESQLRGS